MWKLSQFKMSPQTSILCQNTAFRTPTAPLNVLNVIFMTGLQGWNTEILLLWIDFTLKKLTHVLVPQPLSLLNVRINASTLLYQHWCSNFENNVTVYLLKRNICKSKEKIPSTYHSQLLVSANIKTRRGHKQKAWRRPPRPAWAMLHFNLVQFNKYSAPQCSKSILQGTGKMMGRRDNSE